MNKLRCRNAFISVSRKVSFYRRRQSCCPVSVLFSTDPKAVHATELQKVYDELRILSQEIREHDLLYYTPGLTPKLTDSEYDALVKKEEDICTKYPDLLKRIENDSGLGSSATRYGGRVGLVMPGKGKIHHIENSPMQSLDNAMTNTDVVSWLNRVGKRLLKGATDNTIDKVLEIVTEPKIDGLSLSLRYKIINKEKRKYTLQSAATRGDGTKGENVTAAVLDMHNVPRSLNISNKFDKVPDIIEVRGEIILPRSKFYELKRQSEENQILQENLSVNVSTDVQNSFSNARNAASGILMRKKANHDQSDEEIQNTRRLRSFLRFYAYAIAFADESGKDDFNMYHNGIQLRDLLSELGFFLPEPIKTVAITLHEERDFDEIDCADLFEFHDSIMTSRVMLASESNLDYEIDGAVYKISSMEHRKMLGKIILFCVI